MPRAEQEPQGEKEHRRVFSGVAFISSGQDEGSFLARNLGEEERKAWEEFFEREQAWFKGGEKGPEPEGPPHRHLLEMADLFPQNWRESAVEFEITVKARQVLPSQEPDTIPAFVKVSKLSEPKAVPQSELGMVINQAFGASLADDAKIDEVFPKRFFKTGRSFDNIPLPLRQSWQVTLGELTVPQKSLIIMAVNQVNRVRGLMANPDERYDWLRGYIAPLETVGDLRALSQKTLMDIPGVGKKSAALLYTAFKQPQQLEEQE